MTLAPSTAFAFRFVESLIAHGLQHIVVSPGSRNQALNLAAAEFAERGQLHLYVRVDERDAGFLALGLALESKTPVAIVTTSGTAVANLHPATLEAHHSGVPLLLLTADRPLEERGIGTSQITWQPGMFGAALRWEEDVPPARDVQSAEANARALADSTWKRLTQDDGDPRTIGPVQLNISFAEPLSSADFPEAAEQLPTIVPDARSTTAHVLSRGPRTLVIAGSRAGAGAEELAHAGGWPLIAEVASGSRYGRNLVHGYRELLRDGELTSGIERIVVFGYPTLSREVPALISKAADGVEVVFVRGPGSEDYNPAHRVTNAVTAVTVEEGEDDRDWLGQWMRASQVAQSALDARLASESPAQVAPNVEASRSSDVKERKEFAEAELAAARTPLTRELLALAVWGATWPHDRLLLGASRIIRVLDSVAPGKKIPVFSNRGLAGIDGTISTGIGIAHASGATTRVLLGDLTLLHDAGGMLLMPGEASPRIQVIVGNDRGGTIFDSLEVAGTAQPQHFDRVIRTSVNVDLKQLAAAYGWEYLEVRTVADLERALVTPGAGPQLIEVPL